MFTLGKLLNPNPKQKLPPLPLLLILGNDAATYSLRHAGNTRTSQVASFSSVLNPIEPADSTSSWALEGSPFHQYPVPLYPTSTEQVRRAFQNAMWHHHFRSHRISSGKPKASVMFARAYTMWTMSFSVYPGSMFLKLSMSVINTSWGSLNESSLTS